MAANEQKEKKGGQKWGEGERRTASGRAPPQRPQCPPDALMSPWRSLRYSLIIIFLDSSVMVGLSVRANLMYRCSWRKHKGHVNLQSSQGRAARCGPSREGRAWCLLASPPPPLTHVFGGVLCLDGLVEAAVQVGDMPRNVVVGHLVALVDNHKEEVETGHDRAGHGHIALGEGDGRP